MSMNKTTFLFIATTLLFTARAEAVTSIACAGNICAPVTETSDIRAASATAMAQCQAAVAAIPKKKRTSPAAKCAIAVEYVSDGYGAMVCGDQGCGWSMGAREDLLAIGRAAADCKERSANCKASEAIRWLDVEQQASGYNPPARAAQSTLLQRVAADAARNQTIRDGGRMGSYDGPARTPEEINRLIRAETGR